MSSDNQATIDICINFESIRSIGQNYLNRYYFVLSISLAQNEAIPYQIIPHKGETFSSISLLDYISPLFSLAPYTSYEYRELVVFKSLISICQLKAQALTIRISLHELNISQDREIESVQLQYNSMLGINSYMPICFSQSKCVIDSLITTQFLACRLKNLSNFPKTLLNFAVQSLLITYNRLRQKLSKYKDIQQYKIYNFSELQEVTKFMKIRIFQQSKIEQKERQIQLDKKINKISFSIQQLWSSLLAKQLQVDFQKYRENFIKSFALQIKHNIYMKQDLNECVYNVQGLKIYSSPLSIKTVFKKEAQSFQKGDSNIHHLIFLVHGYGATSRTMQQFQLTLRCFFPSLHIVSSRINEEKTDDNLQQLGRRLSIEVQSSIEAFKLKDNFNISFISHSLGGVIARSSLKFLQQYKYNMKIFISLGSPHLGYFYHNSMITKFGMWAYNFIKKSSSMSFLMMESKDGNYRSSDLYQLSQSLGLEWFQQVILYAGIDDYYVSEQSALLGSNRTIKQDVEKGLQKGVIWEQMQQNITKNLKNVGVSKFLVNFEKQNELKEGSVVDQFIGRRNHINLATSTSFIIALIMNHSNIL